MRINLFTAGDSQEVSTWSNVPYFLAQALVAHDVHLNRINLIPQGPVLEAYRQAHWKYEGLRHRILKEKRPLDIFRDPFVRTMINRRIRHALAQHHEADFNFFLTYSFSSRPANSTPTIHLSDICYAHSLEDQQQTIKAKQRRAIQAERRNLTRASLVLGTNEPCCQYIREHYGVAGARRLPGGINLDWQLPEDRAAYLENKWHARQVLFIGRGVHKRGVDLLLQAFERFNQGRAEPFRLTLIGIDSSEIGPVPDRVECIRYLNKDDPADMARYIGLLESATMFVMPMREGPPPGVVKEALLTGTPVILSNIWHADSKLEHDRCGRLVDQIEADAFANEMTRMAADRERWQDMATYATPYAKQWSWHKTAGDLLEDLCRLRDGGQA
jgi:glycosyltransferase involved in cell wall biosynthesis